MSFRNVIHFDQGDVLSHEITPEGFLNCYMRVAKVGDLQYRNADGSTRTEYVSPETLFNGDSVKTLKMKPVTFEHPPELLNSRTAKNYSTGSTGHLVVPDASFLGITAMIHDKPTIDAILSGKAKEVSCGYTCDLKERKDGKFEQVNRRYNHVAVTRKGRAGNSVAVHMDSVANENVWTQIRVRGDSMSDFQLDFEDGVVRVDAETYQLVQKERRDAAKKMSAMAAKMAKLRAMQGGDDDEDEEDDEPVVTTKKAKKDADCGTRKDAKKAPKPEPEEDEDMDDEDEDPLGRTDSVDQELLAIMIENKLLKDRFDSKKVEEDDADEEETDGDEDDMDMKRKDAADVLNTWIAVADELTPSLIRGDSVVEGIEVEDGALRFDAISATDLKEAYVKLHGLDSVLSDANRFDSLAIDLAFEMTKKSVAKESTGSKSRKTLDSALKTSASRHDADDIRFASLQSDIESGRKRLR